MRRVNMATRDELIAGLANCHSKVGRMERCSLVTYAPIKVFTTEAGQWSAITESRK
jgi:hypothetical protein